MWLPTCYHKTLSLTYGQIFQDFEEHYTAFYQGTCQLVMYFQSVSLGGSKYFHSETFMLTFPLSFPFSLLYLCVCVCLYVSVLALAKRTKVSTQPCAWTKSSTSPLSWTQQWSVNTWHTISNILANVSALTMLTCTLIFHLWQSKFDTGHVYSILSLDTLN